MSLWSRLLNTFRGHRPSSEVDEAVENGRRSTEVRGAFGPALPWSESSRDLRVALWLDSVRADLIFGWRQLVKRKITSGAAILSLGLGIGSCAAAFRLIDALLLRPLPITGAERLYLVAREGLGPAGDYRISESCEYPLFQTMRSAVRDRAELIAVSYADRVDLTFSPADEIEKAYRQFVSGTMFSSFSLRPLAGRLFTDADDRTPGAHPYVVISADFWSRRFGRDPGVVGRNVRIGNDLLEIIGVGPEHFTGTEPGIAADLFVPTMMNPLVSRSDASWFMVFALLEPGVGAEPVRDQLHALTRAFNEQRAKGWSGQTKRFISAFLNQNVVLQPAPGGASGTQRSYRSSLIILGALVTFVLLIACMNVANLMTAQATSRSREIALRISIGAGRRRVIQLVLAESLWLGLLAAIIGAVVAWWAAPFVVSHISSPDHPVSIFLPLDWRVLFFGSALSFAATILFGLLPALRSSAVKPGIVLKGGESPHSSRRLMHALVAIQVASCCVTSFASNLFLATFDRLAHQPTGFSSERLVSLNISSSRNQPPVLWDQVADHLRTVPGVQGVALAGWPLLSGTGWNGFIWVNGAPTEVLGYFLAVSPEWAATMGVPLMEGRDLRATDVNPRVAIVNQAFVTQCFKGQNPIGRTFEKESGDGVTRLRYKVVGVVANARYRNMREPITPTAYVPFRSVNAAGEVQDVRSGVILVRTAGANPMSLAAVLRQEVPRGRPEFRVSNVRSQIEINAQHTIRERLLAMLSVFFAAVALLLAAIGLYGVLDHSVLQRRRELGIRIAIGARPAEIAWLVLNAVGAMLLTGVVCGLLAGMFSLRFLSTLLYQVKGTEPAMVAGPIVVVLGAGILAGVPAVVRAIRINPAQMLRPE